jgi:hypothetical protein
MRGDERRGERKERERREREEREEREYLRASAVSNALHISPPLAEFLVFTVVKKRRILVHHLPHDR